MGRDTFTRYTFLNCLCLFVVGFAATAFADIERATWYFTEYQKAQAAAEAALIQKNQAEYQRQEALARGHLSDARRQYELVGVPESPAHEAFSTYLEVLGAGGDFDLAFRAMETAVTQNPEVEENHYMLGEFAVLAGPSFYENGFKALQEAIKMNPERAESHLRIGQIYRYQLMYREARQHFMDALRLKPDLTEAAIELAATDLRNGRLVEASASLDALGRSALPFDVQTRLLVRDALADWEALGLSIEDSEDFHYSYARLLYRAARLTDALLATYRVVKLNPENGDAWRFIGDMQQQSGNLSGAIQAYEEAVKFVSEKDGLQKLIDELKGAQIEGAN